MSARPYDVVIVGAGLAGSALALALGTSGLRVALVEARALPRSEGAGHGAAGGAAESDVGGYDRRVSAVTPASSDWLAQLGVWPAVLNQRACGYRHMEVWDGAGSGRIRFDAQSVGRLELGHIVENRVLMAALLDRLRAAPVEVLDGAAVEDIRRGGERMKLRLAQGDELSAALLVGADGTRSRVRDWSGLRTREWDYGHRALVATVACEKPHQATAWQRFMPSGPLAFLPLSGAGEHCCSIVWSTLPEHAESLLALDDRDFRRALGAAFEHQLGAVTAVSPRAAFPLVQMHAVNYTQPGLALIGDAAHTIHPLAGQGINLGFADARVLADELLRARNRGLGVGEWSVLQRFQRRRKGDNLAMMAAMDGFKGLFASRRSALLLARNTGLRWLDRSPALKRPLMRVAMGFEPW